MYVCTTQYFSRPGTLVALPLCMVHIGVPEQVLYRDGFLLSWELTNSLSLHAMNKNDY